MGIIAFVLGVAQIGKIDEIIRMRRENANYLTEGLSKIEEMTPPEVPEDYFHVYQMYTIRISGKEGIRDRLKEYLVQH